MRSNLKVFNWTIWLYIIMAFIKRSWRKPPYLRHTSSSKWKTIFIKLTRIIILNLVMKSSWLAGCKSAFWFSITHYKLILVNSVLELFDSITKFWICFAVHACHKFIVRIKRITLWIAIPLNSLAFLNVLKYKWKNYILLRGNGTSKWTSDFLLLFYFLTYHVINTKPAHIVVTAIAL